MAQVLAVTDPVALFRRGLVAELTDAGFDVRVLPDPLLDPPEPGRPSVDLFVVVVRAAIDRQLVAQLRRDHPALPVVAVLFDGTLEDHRALLLAGAVALVPGDGDPQLPVHAVRAALHGLAVLPADFVSAVVSSPAPAGPVLSQRELQWIRDLANGDTALAVSRRHNLSERHLQRLLGDVYQRLGVENRSAALLKAQRLGLLEEPRAEH